MLLKPFWLPLLLGFIDLPASSIVKSLNMVLRPLPLNISSSFRSFWMLWHTHTMGLDIVLPLVSHCHTSPSLFLTKVTCFNGACSLLCGWLLYNSPVSLVRSTQPFQFLVLSSFSLGFRILTRKVSGNHFPNFCWSSALLFKSPYQSFSSRSWVLLYHAMNTATRDH